MKIHRSRPEFGLFVAIALVSLLPYRLAQAGSATWNLNPISGDWNTAANWTPNSAPNGPADTATFGISNTIGVSLSAAVEVNGIVFNPGASVFTLSAPPSTSLTISGAGITNNSGAAQIFVSGNKGSFQFTNGATAGELTSFANMPGDITPFGGVHFNDNSDAGSATITNEPTNDEFEFGSLTDFSDNSTAANAIILNAGGPHQGGTTNFLDSANAGNATITCEAGTADGAALGNGNTTFFATSSAANAAIIAYGAASSMAFGGTITFNGTGTPTAGNATLMAYGGGFGGFSPGTITFSLSSRGGTAHVEVYGDGTLDITDHDAPGLTIGSLSGNGVVSLSGKNLTVGNGGFDSKFDGTINGVIREGGGSLTKIGAGSLRLSRNNSYFAGTTVKAGTLVVHNRAGSATGTGLVQVLGGTLAGDGIISGAVTVGGSGHKATLSAGTSLRNPGLLTIRGLVSLNASGTYKCGLRSDSSVAAEVAGGGVSIDSASFSLVDSGTATLAPGTVFTVISNTSASPTSGTFTNLPDGGTIVVGSNTFQADYEGGDGNDLTLSVVP